MNLGLNQIHTPPEDAASPSQPPKNYCGAINDATVVNEAAVLDTMNSLLFRSSTRRIATWRPVVTVLAPQQAQLRAKHTVRVILQDDLPNGKAYAGEVLHVAAGYARNYLIPQRKALYATRQNFAKLGVTDPDLETPEERHARLARERLESEDQDLKAADLLKSYLRNKVVSFLKTVVHVRKRKLCDAVVPAYLSVFFCFLIHPSPNDRSFPCLISISSRCGVMSIPLRK